MTSISDQGNRSVPFTIVGRRPMDLLPGAPEAADRMYEMIVGYWMSQIAGGTDLRTALGLSLPSRSRVAV